MKIQKIIKYRDKINQPKYLTRHKIHIQVRIKSDKLLPAKILGLESKEIPKSYLSRMFQKIKLG